MSADKKAVKKNGGFMKKLIDKAEQQKKYIQQAIGEESTIYTTDPAVDWVMGGFKRGRSNLLYGPSGAGKSTMALILAGIEQKKSGGYVIIYDAEYAHDANDPDVITRWSNAGLNPEMVIAISSNSVNELFGNIGDLEADLSATREGLLAGVPIEKIANGIKISAILVDAWGSISSEQAEDKLNAGNISGAANQYGGNAKTINPILMKLLRISATHGITSIFVQHCIENMDKMPNGAYKGPKWILLGGQKLRYLCQGIMFMETIAAADAMVDESGGTVKKDAWTSAVGKKIRIRCDKSRKQMEGRKAETWINFSDCSFLNKQITLFSLATGLNVITHPMVQSKDKKGKLEFDSAGNPVMKQSANNVWAYIGHADNPDNHFKTADRMIAELLANDGLYKAVWNDCLNSKNNAAIDDLVGVEEGVEGDTIAEDLEGLEISNA